MSATAETARKPPPARVIEAIARHHGDAHGLEFDLDRDVYFPGNTPDATTYDVSSDPVRGERFWCAICGQGRVFSVGEPPYGTPQRNGFVQRTSPYLQGLLAGAPLEDQDTLTEAYDRRQVGRRSSTAPEDQATPTSTTGNRRAAPMVRHGPAYERRIEGFRRYFLAAYADTGSVDRAIDGLIALHKSDPDAYAKILGTSRLLSEETFRQYAYKETSKAEREQARKQWRTGREKRRASR